MVSSMVIIAHHFVFANILGHSIWEGQQVGEVQYSAKLINEWVQFMPTSNQRITLEKDGETYVNAGFLRDIPDQAPWVFFSWLHRSRATIA